MLFPGKPFASSRLCVRKNKAINSYEDNFEFRMSNVGFAQRTLRIGDDLVPLL